MHMTTASYKVITTSTNNHDKFFGLLTICLTKKNDEYLRAQSHVTPPTWHHGHGGHGGDAPDVVHRDWDICEGHRRLLTTGVPRHRRGQPSHHPRHRHHLVTLEICLNENECSVK